MRDGTSLTIRFITPDDKQALRDAFHSASARTRYLRFMGMVGELSDETLTYLTNVDQEDHVAIAAVVTSPDLKTERGVGVARFIRMKGSPEIAEAAITVADDMQNKGVGGILAHELERLARARGIRAIRADVLGSNAAMRAILDAAGARRVASEDPSVACYEIDLERNEGPLVRILRAAARAMPWLNASGGDEPARGR